MSQTFSLSEWLNDELTKYTSQIENDPNNTDLYQMRSGIYQLLDRYDDAIEDITIAINSNPNDAFNYKRRAEIYLLSGNYDDALKDCGNAIEKKLNDSIVYHIRANAYLKKGDFDKAIHDYTKAINLNPKDAGCYSDRADAFVKNREIEKALADYSKAIEIKPSSHDHFERGQIYQAQKNYHYALDDYTASIKLDPDNYAAYFHRAEIHTLNKNYSEAKKDYTKAIEIEPNYIEWGLAYGRRGVVNYELGEFYEAMADFERAPELTSEESDPLEYQGWRQETAAQIAKIEERNKVIENLSHSIKNLISTVIVPLEKLKQTTTFQPHIIQNALKGANLIREIVNAVNLSYKGSKEDLLYDVRHNSGSDAMSLASMFLESLKHSVSNMFDGKYFHNFMRKYFSEKEFFLSAKQDWENLSQSDTISALEPFLTKYFFRLDIDIADADQFIIGNEQGSAVKLLILLQEIILNAVKYAAFVKKEDRFLKILFAADENTVNIRVENTFVEKVKTKTTGTGHVIISNFAKLLGTEPVVKKENGIYSLQITFQNFWEVAEK